MRLPVVNIGDRQKGRLRADNVIDAAAEPDAIVAALSRALTPAFRAALPAEGPFGDGRAASRIIDILRRWQPPRPPIKPPVPV